MFYPNLLIYEIVLKKGLHGFIILSILFIQLTSVSCMTCKKENQYRLGFPIQGQVTVYDTSHQPIGTLDGPWLFEAEQLSQPGQMIPLSHLDYGKHWGVRAYVEKNTITLPPPTALRIADKWTMIPIHPGQSGTSLEGIELRIIENRIELRVRWDLTFPLYYRYPIKQ